MNTTDRRVFNTLANLTDPTVATICRATGIHATVVESALARLVAREWVRQKDSVFYVVSPRAVTGVDQVISYYGAKGQG